jgi:hypothetical protein
MGRRTRSKSQKASRWCRSYRCYSKESLRQDPSQIPEGSGRCKDCGVKTLRIVALLRVMHLRIILFVAMISLFKGHRGECGSISVTYHGTVYLCAVMHASAVIFLLAFCYWGDNSIGMTYVAAGMNIVIKGSHCNLIQYCMSVVQLSTL